MIDEVPDTEADRAPDQVSVVVPTLNEVAVIGRLLGALAAQSRPPDQIIVADAGSLDGTAQKAAALGATVVSGPRAGPGAGRNDGARHARGSVLFFLDADTVPAPEFVERALAEMSRRGLVVATCLMTGLGQHPGEDFMLELANGYMRALESVSPRAPGWCILAHRRVHQAIGGFDESLRLAEDHDYVRRACLHGRFGVLCDVRIAVSMRRVDEEGVLPLALKYAWCEAHAFAGRPVRGAPFAYRFGEHAVARRRGTGHGASAGGRAQRALRLGVRRAARPLLRRARSPRRP